jgi:hypothetical protein
MGARPECRVYSKTPVFAASGCFTAAYKTRIDAEYSTWSAPVRHMPPLPTAVFRCLPAIPQPIRTAEALGAVLSAAQLSGVRRGRRRIPAGPAVPPGNRRTPGRSALRLRYPLDPSRAQQHRRPDQHPGAIAPEPPGDPGRTGGRGYLQDQRRRLELATGLR